MTVQNLPTTCEQIKAVLEALSSADVSSTARLLAVLEAIGVCDRGDLQRLTGVGERMVRKAKAELGCRNQSAGGTIVPEPECRTGTRVPETEPECRNQSAESCPAPRARAHFESPSEIVTPVKDNTPSSVPPKPKGLRSPKGSRLAKDWSLPDEWRQWTRINFAHASDGQVTSEAESFRDYWHAKAGAGATKLDWEATWRNWCRKAFAAIPRPLNTQRMSWDESKAQRQAEFAAQIRQMGYLQPEGAA